MLRRQVLRWLLTTVILVLVVAALRAYEQRGNSSSKQKEIFNAIITALGVVLALGFFVRISLLSLRLALTIDL